MIDNRGTAIEVGLPVAFNLSGQVARGLVVKLRRNAWGYSAHRIEVELSHDAAGCKRGHISKIKHERSVLVLLDGES